MKLDEIKALEEAAKRSPEVAFQGDTESDRFYRAANPAAILSLIAHIRDQDVRLKNALIELRKDDEAMRWERDRRFKLLENLHKAKVALEYYGSKDIRVYKVKDVGPVDEDNMAKVTLNIVENGEMARAALKEIGE